MEMTSAAATLETLLAENDLLPRGTYGAVAEEMSTFRAEVNNANAAKNTAAKIATDDWHVNPTEPATVCGINRLDLAASSQ